MDLKYKPYL